MAAIVEGIGYLSFDVVLAVILAIVLSQFVAAVPGLGGAFTLAVLLPFVWGLDPLLAIAVMVGASVTSGTGNTVTSVVFGVPGSPIGVATVFDGFPMAKRGEAGRAISAGLVASAVGGVIGAAALVLLLPIVRPIVLAVGSAEFFILIVFALYAIAFIRDEAFMKALLAGGFGLSLSFIGMEASTGVPRFTFGQLYLWEGLKIVPFMIGLFAVSEMISLIRKGGTIAEATGVTTGSGALQGFIDVFTHWRATLKSSLVGVGVGILPGLGAQAAQFMAYASVARTSKNTDPPFGSGNIEGVIAADAATNSKEGGALLPSLAFGIPGSSSMAILLAALVMFGVQPGPSMLTDKMPVVWMIVAILVFSNLFATSFVMLFTPLFVKLTYVRASLLAPPIIVIALFGAYATTRRLGDVYTALGVGVLGYFMSKYGYSKSTFVIGFVLGPLLESNFQLARQLYGTGFLWNRPIARALLIALIAMILWSIAKPLLGITDKRKEQEKQLLAVDASFAEIDSDRKGDADEKQ